MQTSLATEVAKLYLEYGVITFHIDNPKIRNQGKVSPIDFHFKKLLEDSSARGKFKELIIKFFDELSLKHSWNNIVGINQSGMYPATIISDTLNLPLLAKKDASNACKTTTDLVVLDIISQGKTSRNFINSDVFTCFSYNLFRRENLFVLCDFHTIIKVALEKEIINAKEENSLLSWQNNPKSWVENHLSMKLL
jgi:hypothetical protein